MNKYQWNLYINQKAIIDNKYDIDAIDALIFDIFRHSLLVKGNSKKMHEGEPFVLFTWKHVDSQLPILKLKERAIKTRIKKLVNAGLIEMHPNNQKECGSFYGVGNNFNSMFSSDDTYADKCIGYADKCIGYADNDIPLGSNMHTPMQINAYYNNNKDNKDNNNKESENTPSNDLNSIQEKAGNKSYDPRPLRDDEVKNKYTDLTQENKKLLWDELINLVWTYANKKKWINNDHPKRWEILELAIKDFYGHHIDKGSFESEFFNYERKLIQWIDKDVLRDSSIPYSVWNKTNKDITSDPKQSEEHPKYYDTQYKRKCTVEQWKVYRKWLIDSKYYCKRSNVGETWMTPEGTNAEFKDIRRKA